MSYRHALAASRRIDARCVALYEAGVPMEEIGRRLGVSRERVRQRIRRAEERGAHVTPGPRLGSRRTDPNAVVKLVRRDPTVASWAEVARRLRRASSAVRRAVAAAGLFEPIDRLLRLRRRSRRVWSQQRVLVEVARIAAAHKRAPSTAYLMRHYPALAAAIYKFFESYHDVCESLGLSLRARSAEALAKLLVRATSELERRGVPRLTSSARSAHVGAAETEHAVGDHQSVAIRRLWGCSLGRGPHRSLGRYYPAISRSKRGLPRRGLNVGSILSQPGER
jgi:DNA-binding Lrp family transcriptional regulator